MEFGRETPEGKLLCSVIAFCLHFETVLGGGCHPQGGFVASSAL